MFKGTKTKKKMKKKNSLFGYKLTLRHVIWHYSLISVQLLRRSEKNCWSVQEYELTFQPEGPLSEDNYTLLFKSTHFLCLLESIKNEFNLFIYLTQLKLKLNESLFSPLWPNISARWRGVLPGKRNTSIYLVHTLKII